MRLDEGGDSGGEPAAIAERQVERLPARRPPHAMRALESQEELVAREGIGSCAEGVPLPRVELPDAAVEFGTQCHRLAPSRAPACPESRGIDPRRSEEHTSELQSRVDLVCRLLLEKKNSRTARTGFPGPPRRLGRGVAEHLAQPRGVRVIMILRSATGLRDRP